MIKIECFTGPAGPTAPVGPFTLGDRVAPVAPFAPGEPTYQRLTKVESSETVPKTLQIRCMLHATYH